MQWAQSFCGSSPLGFAFSLLISLQIYLWYLYWYLCCDVLPLEFHISIWIHLFPNTHCVSVFYNIRSESHVQDITDSDVEDFTLTSAPSGHLRYDRLCLLFLLWGWYSFSFRILSFKVNYLVRNNWDRPRSMEFDVYTYIHVYIEGHTHIATQTGRHHVASTSSHLFRIGF